MYLQFWTFIEQWKIFFLGKVNDGFVPIKLKSSIYLITNCKYIWKALNIGIIINFVLEEKTL